MRNGHRFAPSTSLFNRYFAGVIRAEEGTASELDGDTLSLCIQEPLGVVGQIIPWNFPLLMATWKLAPALAAGNCVVRCSFGDFGPSQAAARPALPASTLLSLLSVPTHHRSRPHLADPLQPSHTSACPPQVLKPAEQTPTSIMALMELIKDVVPPGVINVVTGYGAEAGKALAESTGIAKIAFTGSTDTGTAILSAAAANLIPATMELGGKSPNIFFSSIADHDDALFDKAVEGAVLFALNQGEVCTCQSRLLIQEDIYDKFMERVVERTEAIKTGDPMDPETMMGAQVSLAQHDRIVEYIELGKAEGAKVLTGGSANDAVAGGYYVKPTILSGTNDMRVFQEEIFGPVTAATTFKDEAEAVAIANDTIYGLGAGVWTRDMHQAYQVPRAIQAGRVWVNCYHAYPAHAPFGGYKRSGFGRETHKMMLNHYRQTKNMLISHSKNKLGFF